MPEDELDSMRGDRLESISEVPRGSRSPRKGLKPISGVNIVIGPGLLAVLGLGNGTGKGIISDLCLG
jgi:hypothetical protein